MGSDESHFNVSVGSDGQSHKIVSTNHNLFEEKGETKRYQTGGPSAYQPYRWAKPAHHWADYLVAACMKLARFFGVVVAGFWVLFFLRFQFLLFSFSSVYLFSLANN